MPIPPTTAASMSTIQKSISSTLLACLAAACAPNGEAPLRTTRAPVDAAPANQLVVSGNACGPAALVNSFRFADERWQAAKLAIDGETDRGRIFTIIRRHGMRPSPHLGDRPRWSRSGVSVIDLADMANEINATTGLPAVRHEVLVTRTGESPARQLARTQRRIHASLANGFPPILSIRRFALRENDRDTREWIAIDSHFVTITHAPRRIPRRSKEFTIRYIDPWGAQRDEGRIHVSDALLTAVPFPEARFPEANVGRDRLQSGEETILVASAVIGYW